LHRREGARRSGNIMAGLRSSSAAKERSTRNAWKKRGATRSTGWSLRVDGGLVGAALLFERSAYDPGATIQQSGPFAHEDDGKQPSWHWRLRRFWGGWRTDL